MPFLVMLLLGFFYGYGRRKRNKNGFGLIGWMFITLWLFLPLGFIAVTVIENNQNLPIVIEKEFPAIFGMSGFVIEYFCERKMDII